MTAAWLLTGLTDGNFARAQCLRYSTQIASGVPCGAFGHTPAIPGGLNDAGVVVGGSGTCAEVGMPFIWSSGPNVTLIPIPGASNAGATGVNSAMQIIGVKTGSGMHTGFVYQNGTSIDIGLLPGTNLAEALAINERGQICGYAQNVITGPYKAFLWENGVLSEIVTSIGPHRVANNINDFRQVIGWMGQAQNPPFESQGFIWDNGVTTPLGNPPGGGNSNPTAISNTGHLCGYAIYPNPSGTGFLRRSFYWRDGVFTDLGTLPGFTGSLARDTNDNGLIAGLCDKVGLLSRAFIWRNGVMQDLNTLIPPNTGVHLYDVAGINNAGQIACQGIDQNADYVSVLLTPIPPVLGDINCDWLVNHLDLLQVIGAWGDCPAPVPPLDSQCPADLNHDSRVNVQDLLFVINHWSAN